MRNRHGLINGLTSPALQRRHFFDGPTDQRDGELLLGLVRRLPVAVRAMETADLAPARHKVWRCG